MTVHSAHSAEISAPAEPAGAAATNGGDGELDGTVDRLARIGGVAVPALLIVVAALHAAWALGSPWPAGSERELAEAVLGQGEREQLDGGLPPAPLTWAVALALLAAAAIVRTTATGARSRALRGAAWGVSAVFLVRGVVYLPSDLIGGLDDTYQRLDLAIYSPLCLALGAGTALVARRVSPAALLGLGART